MPLLISITVGVLMAASVYLLLSRELKAIAMGIFLLSHAANLAIIAVSRNPLSSRPPVLGQGGLLTGNEADPLPQALILTAIVIGFALQAFLLVLLVVTWRRSRTLELSELAAPPAPVEFLRRSHDPRLRRLTVEDLTVAPEELAWTSERPFPTDLEPDIPAPETPEPRLTEPARRPSDHDNIP